MKVAAFTRYGPRAASTRQRFVQYFPALGDAGIQVEHHPLLGDDYVAGLVTGEAYPKTKLLKAYAARLADVADSRDCDAYWVYVELLPYLPALAERLATARKPIVYDFDDAFFHSYDQSPNPAVRLMLGNKHASLLRRAAACTCGNAYLRDYAARYCPKSVVVPTVVNTNAYLPAKATRSPPTIGWIGSPSTWRGVQPILPQLKDVVAGTGARFLVVGAGRAAEADIFPGMELRDWSEATEIADVQEMDIGIMPLLDQPFERGKSGYKLIQYMACGLPVVASPVGVNAQIVKDGVNGFLASTGPQWSKALERLLGDPDLRRRMGEHGRASAVADYSLASQAPRLVELFNSLGR
jgi:glycosyltransferase involved in cell wall biosynthesis